MAGKLKWFLNGDCTEACTSPPVCPYYWGSSTPKDQHGGKNQCEGVFTFNVRSGYYGDIELSGLKAAYAFNTAEGGTASKDPWKAVIYIDSNADEKQTKVLQDIFTQCWSMGNILGIKKLPVSFNKERVGSKSNPGYKHSIEWKGAYILKTEPILTPDGRARYISGMMNGKIYIGKSTENKLDEPSLPRGQWDRPGMSNTYYRFSLSPSKLSWMP
jgi:hypothetical protein